MRVVGPRVLISVALLFLLACGDDVSDGGDAGTGPAYAFASRFAEGEDSVEFAGQTARQILLSDLLTEMGSLATGVRDGIVDPTMVDEPGEVVARLDALYRGGSAEITGRRLPNLVLPPATTCQTTYGDLGGANLFSKTAGQDPVTDNRDWSTDLVGFDAGSLLGGAPVGTPVELVDAIFAAFEAQVRACALNVDDCASGPSGEPIPLYVTPDGLDLVELLEKHLLGAIHFSQGVDDYLDDDVIDKGLLSDNTMPWETGARSTTLEHAWDEAFGYFGAAADYDHYTDDEIRGVSGRDAYAGGYHDTNGDGCIDVSSEYNFAASINAAKRDAGSATMTDLTADVFDAFVAGRAVITAADGALNDAQAAQLARHRDAVAAAWERAFAATAIHYLNDLGFDTGRCGTADYSFVDHAKHWSELKGFTLSFQYNRRSPFNTGADFAALHTVIGDRPVLCDGDFTAYEISLLAAREAIREAYGFDPADAQAW